MSKMVTILGATASGKTALALKLAKQFNGEIICADSRTIYKNMDIGTAKPAKDEQKIVTHHLLDVVDIGKHFSVAEFKQLASQTIADIQKRGKLPFLVGGSGLYIDAILFDYQFERHKKPVNDDSNNLSLSELQSRVALEFPEIELNNSEQNNYRRLQRILSLGIVKSDDRKSLKIESLVLGLEVKMPILKQNITVRTESMLNNQFIQEVKILAGKYGQDCAQLQTTGYKEVLNYLSGEGSKSILEDSINAATYKLARKQLTWFRRNPNIVWISDEAQASHLVSDYLKL